MSVVLCDWQPRGRGDMRALGDGVIVTEIITPVPDYIVCPCFVLREHNSDIWDSDEYIQKQVWGEQKSRLLWGRAEGGFTW